MKFIIKEKGDFVCKARMLKNGLFVGNSLVSSTEGVGTVNIINSDITNKFIKTIDLDLESLTNYQIVNYIEENINEHINSQKERINTLLNIVKTDHLNEEESTAIVELFRKYADLFALEGDALSCCDAVQHQIPLLTDSTP